MARLPAGDDEVLRRWLRMFLVDRGPVGMAAFHAGVGLDGTVTAIAGRTTERPQVQITRSAGVRQADSDAVLNEKLGTWFAGGDSWLLIEEDAALPEDPELAERAQGTFMISQAVHHYIRLDGSGVEAAAFIRAGRQGYLAGYPTVAFIIQGMTFPPAGDDVEGEPIAEAITRRIVAALTTAYDGEVYVIWQPGVGA